MAVRIIHPPDASVVSTLQLVHRETANGQTSLWLTSYELSGGAKITDNEIPFERFGNDSYPSEVYCLPDLNSDGHDDFIMVMSNFDSPEEFSFQVVSGADGRILTRFGGEAVAGGPTWRLVDTCLLPDSRHNTALFAVAVDTLDNQVKVEIYDLMALTKPPRIAVMDSSLGEVSQIFCGPDLDSDGQFELAMRRPGGLSIISPDDGRLFAVCARNTMTLSPVGDLAGVGQNDYVQLLSKHVISASDEHTDILLEVLDAKTSKKLYSTQLEVPMPLLYVVGTRGREDAASLLVLHGNSLSCIRGGGP